MREPIALIGHTNFRNQNRAFGIRRPDRLFHMLILGKTGSGKSTVMAGMMRSDLRNGEGFALLDAHGDLAEQVLSMVPDERLPDVVYINPALEEFRPGVNLLEGGSHLAVSEVLSVFRHLYPEFWGPRTEYVLRNCLLLLTEAMPQASLCDVPKVLTSDAFRENLARRLRPGDLREYWLREFAGYSKHLRGEVASPILNKLGAVALNPVTRPVLCSRASAIDFRDVMDSGKILIANLAKGALGEDSSSLLGSMLLSKLVLSGLSRSSLEPKRRRFFAVYADEAQLFLTESSLSLFAELRKYGIAGVWATQYLGSLPERVRQSILGNAGSLLSFAASAEDADMLAREFAPAIRARDLLALPAFHFYLKLKIDGAASRPFSGVTIPCGSNGRMPRRVGLKGFADRHVEWRPPPVLGKQNDPPKLF